MTASLDTPAPDPLLVELAGQLGVQPGFWDVGGTWHDASDEAIRAALAAMVPELGAQAAPSQLAALLDARASRVLAPVVVCWGPGPIGFELTVPDGLEGCARVEVVFEEGGGSTFDLELAALPEVGRVSTSSGGAARRRVGVDLVPPVGRHRIEVELGGARHVATLLAAPWQVVGLGPDERLWGVFAPVYSMRSELGVGPDLDDLFAVGAWMDRLGGKVVGTLPMLASFLDEPFEPSPYAPVSRRFWNELYLDLEALPELAASQSARELLAAPDTQREIAELRAASRFDYRRQADLTTRVLGELARTFRDAGGFESIEFARFRAERPDVDRYARFRAVATARGEGWPSWPDPARAGRIERDACDPDVIDRHRYAQLAMHRQMHELADGLRARGQLLYLDLPVGAHRAGYDTWTEQELFAWDVGAGAPPDAFFVEGQDWGFPPIRPDASREQGHRHLADCMRHHMEVAGMLRLDHVMQLHRLYWVPAGLGATQGVYVHYPLEELMAVVTIESARSSCAVVGEDLGTVPDEIREAMGQHGLLGMYVAQFDLPSWPGADLGGPHAGQLAAFGTHDTPTFTSFVRGLDIAARHDMGLVDDDALGGERAEREQAVANLVRFLADRDLLDEPGGEHEVLRGLLRYLGDSDSPALLVSLDDLWGEPEPHNVPGTATDRPNWVLRMRDSLAELAVDEAVRRDLESVQASRLASHARAGERT